MAFVIDLGPRVIVAMRPSSDFRFLRCILVSGYQHGPGYPLLNHGSDISTIPRSMRRRSTKRLPSAVNHRQNGRKPLVYVPRAAF